MEQRFIVTITGTQNYTWQGTLTTPGETVFFQSECELLRGINRLLPREAAAFWGAYPQGAALLEGGPRDDV